MEIEYWEHDNQIIELLLESNMSVREMAADMQQPETKILSRIKMLGLEWVPKKNKGVSRGQTALTKIMQKLMPGAHIVNEFHIGESLRLDVYCPQYKLAVEYHGRQHFFHVSRFHETYDDFIRAQQRDDRKIELCKEQGIQLVSFRYCDELTEDAVFDRILDAMKTTTDDVAVIKKKPRYSAKNHPQYVERKEKQNTYRRELRQKIKVERKIRAQNRTSEDEEQYDLD